MSALLIPERKKELLKDFKNGFTERLREINTEELRA